jgi:hypothetical protein
MMTAGVTAETKKQLSPKGARAAGYPFEILWQLLLLKILYQIQRFAVKPL